MNKIRVCLSLIGLTTTGLLSNSVTRKATAKTIEPPTSNQNWNAKLRYRQTRHSPPVSSSLNNKHQQMNRTFNSIYDISQKRSSQPVKVSYQAADLYSENTQNLHVSPEEKLPPIPPDSEYNKPMDNKGVQPEKESPIIPPKDHSLEYQPTSIPKDTQYQSPEYQPTSIPKDTQYQSPEYQPASTPIEDKYQAPANSQDGYIYESESGYSDSESRYEYQYKQQRFQVRPLEKHSIESARKLRVIPIIGYEEFSGIPHKSEGIDKFSLQEIPDREDEKKWSITPEIGTLGVGFSGRKKLSSQFDARVGIHAGGLGLGDYTNDKDKDHEDHEHHEDHEDHEEHYDNVTYDSDLSLFNVSTLVDYRPFQNSGFHITSGLVFNNNHINSDAKIKEGDDYFSYNGNNYSHDDISAVKGKVSFPNKIAPYIGVGWKKPVKYGDKWGFSMNLGVMFPGSPNVELTPEIGNEELREQILADVKAEEKDIEDDLKGFGVYPVLSLGVSYHF